MGQFSCAKHKTEMPTPNPLQWPLVGKVVDDPERATCTRIVISDAPSPENVVATDYFS